MSASMVENLADVARRRHQARQPAEQERGGVNALLGKLRIEQERQRQNVAVRTARIHIKNESTHLRYAYTSSRTPSSEQFSFLSDQVDPTAPLNPTPRPTGRRRTPGPSAPASWSAPSSSRLTLTQKTLTAEETLERRWRMYELWCGEIVEGYVRAEQMPFEVQRRRRRRRDAENFRGARTSRGSPSLVNTTLRLLSRYMDPPATSDTEPSWLASADVKRYLGTQVRMAIMVHGVWERWTTWRGVRDLAAGEEDVDQVGGDAGGENEGDDWDAASSASETTSSPVPHLSILDFSFCQINTARDLRHLARYLATPAVHSSTEAISFAGTSMSPIQAVDLLSSTQGKSGAWMKLKSVSLAGLRGSEEEWKVAFGKLSRCASGLEFLDLSAAQLVPHQHESWRTLLTALLGAHVSGTTNRFTFPSLRTVGFRDCHTPSPGTDSVALLSSGSKGENSGGEGANGDAMYGYEADVKRLVRSFGRPRWVEVVVR